MEKLFLNLLFNIEFLFHLEPFSRPF